MLSPTTSPGPWPGSRSQRAWIYAIALLLAPVSRASAQWRLEAWLGDAWSLPSHLTLTQYGEPVISQTADWSTRPLEATVYYSGRLVHWSGSKGWAIEYTHHKIFLDNPAPGVQYFRITNGVNFFVPERVWNAQGWEFGGGAGPVFVVPVSSVRDLVYNRAHGIFGSQYDLGGAVLQANLAHRIKVFSFFSGVGSLKLTGSWLRTQIANGHAETLNLALHAGYGFSLGKQ